MNISHFMIGQQAIKFNAALGDERIKDFKASNGFISNFVQRNGLRQEVMSGEKLSNDQSAVEPFIFKLKLLINTNH